MQNNLKAIKVQGNITFIFDENLFSEGNNVERFQTFDSFLNSLLEQGNFTEEEKSKVLDMTVKDFVIMCRQAEERTREGETSEGSKATRAVYPKMQVLKYPEKINCPVCKAQGLQIVDGYLKCPVCGQNFGDIDSLPETF